MDRTNKNQRGNLKSELLFSDTGKIIDFHEVGDIYLALMTD